MSEQNDTEPEEIEQRYLIIVMLHLFAGVLAIGCAIKLMFLVLG